MIDSGLNSSVKEDANTFDKRSSTVYTVITVCIAVLSFIAGCLVSSNSQGRDLQSIMQRNYRKELKYFKQPRRLDNDHSGEYNSKVSNTDRPKLAFISASFGEYEKRLKKVVKQTIPVDLICFSPNKELIPNGWELDPTEYHLTHPSRYDYGHEGNSFAYNTHPFNLAKYYKQQFQNIPRLKHYDVIVWIDASLEIHNPKTAEWAYNHIVNQNKKIILFGHEFRGGDVRAEVAESVVFDRYNSNYWLGIYQPLQNVSEQFQSYTEMGYTGNIWRNIKAKNNITHPLFGVWMTGFIIFDNKNAEVSHFLDFWHLQNLIYTTQDQVSFPFAVFKANVYPYTLPDGEITGYAHSYTSFYKKWEHGHRLLGLNRTNDGDLNSTSPVDIETTESINSLETIVSELEEEKKEEKKSVTSRR